MGVMTAKMQRTIYNPSKENSRYWLTIDAVSSTHTMVPLYLHRINRCLLIQIFNQGLSVLITTCVISTCNIKVRIFFMQKLSFMNFESSAKQMTSCGKLMNIHTPSLCPIYKLKPFFSHVPNTGPLLLGSLQMNEHWLQLLRHLKIWDRWLRSFLPR